MWVLLLDVLVEIWYVVCVVGYILILLNIGGGFLVFYDEFI